MSKILTVIFAGLIYLFYPPFALAQTISDIGDLNVEEIKTVAVSGLEPGRKYQWKESKATSAVPTRSYTSIFTDCYITDNSGSIQKDIGPFSTPGLYRLEISRTNTPTGGRCESVGGPITSKDFSVGGPTGQDCCSYPLIIYDRNKDVCKKDFFAIGTNPESPTACSNSGTYCEPESLRCFTAKTSVLAGKICKDPNEPSFDPNKNVVCGSSGGQKAPGCTDAKYPNGSPNPGIATAIGCIHTNPAEFVKDLMTWVLGIGGGLAFLMMLLGAFQMLTSAGNPETLNAGRERLTSAVIGLLFIIFAVLLLQIIGFDILKIPGFGR